MKSRALLSAVAIAVILSSCTAQKNSSSPHQNADPFSVPTTQTVSRPIEEKKVLMEPVIIYELNPEQFGKKTSEIPSYNNGEITYLTTASVKSFNEGHSVTWSDPLVCTLLRISNLIPVDYSSDKTIDEQLAKHEGGYLNKTVSLKSETNIVFTKQPTNMETNETAVEVQVPQWGTYTVTWRNGTDSDIQIIQKIVFEKAADFQFDLASKPILIFSLSNEILKGSYSTIPYYARGEIGYVTKEDIQSVNEGHSPWKATPVLTVEAMAVNLIPEEIKTNQYKVVQVKDAGTRNETTLIKVKVVNLGTYVFTVKFAENSPISFIAKIELQPD